MVAGDERRRRERRGQRGAWGRRTGRGAERPELRGCNGLAPSSALHRRAMDNGAELELPAMLNRDRRSAMRTARSSSSSTSASRNNDSQSMGSSPLDPPLDATLPELYMGIRLGGDRRRRWRVKSGVDSDV